MMEQWNNGKKGNIPLFQPSNIPVSFIMYNKKEIIIKENGFLIQINYENSTNRESQGGRCIYNRA